MPHNIHRAYAVVGAAQQPLAERFETTRERLRRLDPAHPALNRHMDEWAIAEMADVIDAIERKRAAARHDPDPALKAAKHEHWQLRTRYHSAWCDLRDVRGKASTIARSTANQILGLIPVNACDEFPLIDPSGGPEFASTDAARRACSEFLPSVLFLENLLEQVKSAIGVSSWPSGDRAIACIDGLWNGMQLLTARIEQLEEKLAPPKPITKSKPHRNGKRRKIVVRPSQIAAAQ
jgi:hypothetical protein